MRQNLNIMIRWNEVEFHRECVPDHVSHRTRTFILELHDVPFIVCTGLYMPRCQPVSFRDPGLNYATWGSRGAV